jgi:hypothetical protein
MGGAYCARAIRNHWRKVRAKLCEWTQRTEKYRNILIAINDLTPHSPGGSCRTLRFLPGGGGPN